MQQTKVVLVTPKLAEEWLLKNNCNRNMRRYVVAQLARDMRNGRWQFNGESIKFSADGRLLDGQHRLSAVVESGETIMSVIVYNLAEEAQGTIDTGLGRTLSDRLALDGEIHTSTLAALLRRIYLWDSGQYMKSTGVRLSHSELAAVLEREPGARWSAKEGHRIGQKAPLRPSLIAFCHWLFSNLDEDAARYFLERLADGAELPVEHPILTLRDRLERERRISGRHRADSAYILALVIRAWNAYREGRSPNMLKVALTELTNENYPKPR